MADEEPTSDPGPPGKDLSAYLASGFLVGGGRFSLLRELARGGMGVVWLAQDERLMALVALKFLSETVRANPAALNDLRQETHKSRMLSHPNILRIYDLYEAPDEAAFISMEYVDGPSLWTLRTQQPDGFFAWDYLKPILKQACQALDYAHSEGVIHRDLKPANMLLDERQRLRLADFGVAAWAFESSATGAGPRSSSGTLEYMSPQQIAGETASVTDDIYALGATFYELLSGHPPFYENDIAYQAGNILATPLSERLAELGVDNEVPPTVAAMIMACLSKDPEKRPPSARAVAEWIGLRDSRALPMTSFASQGLTISETSGSGGETRTTGAQPASATERAASPPAAEPALRHRLAWVIGFAVLGVLAWMAWGLFTPRMAMEQTPVPLPAAKTNAVDSEDAPAGNAPDSDVPVVSNTATAPPESATTVSIELAMSNRENGLREVTGTNDPPTSPATMGGKECRLLIIHGLRGHCDFQISQSFKRPEPMSARIQVEYYAVSRGVMYLLFDGPSRQVPHYANGGRVNFEGDGVWKTANFQVNNAYFRNGQNDGADFRVATTSPELYIRGVTVFFDE